MKKTLEAIHTHTPTHKRRMVFPRNSKRVDEASLNNLPNYFASIYLQILGKTGKLTVWR